MEIEGGRVIDARSSGIYFRGLELILRNRDPRDAPYLTQRICGICSSAHALASARALDQAFGLDIPPNAVLLRNLVFGADLLQNHIRHFYVLGLPDFARGPDQPPWTPRYEKGYRFTRQQTRRLTDHYLEALEASRLAHEMVVVFGGKVPHQHGIVAGGATVPPSADNIRLFGTMLERVASFIENRLLPDTELLADTYRDYYQIGRGHGHQFSYGGLPDPGRGGQLTDPPGVVINGEIRPLDQGKIVEHLRFSWYQENVPRHPAQGETVPDPGKGGAYSWVKAPRYEGLALETGPLARLWLAGEYRRGVSAMDRIVARALEARRMAHFMKDWLDQLNPNTPVFQPFNLPGRAEGFSLSIAMRGGLGHWVKIENGRIAAYQIITPSAWNQSPRDDKGQRGPVEEALVGTPIEDPESPIEVGRVARSFDPCLACATHVILPGGHRFVLEGGCP